MVKESDARRAKLWFAAREESLIVVFEPMGDEFEISPGRDIYLDLPEADTSLIEIGIWKNGLAVTLPYPGDNSVLDHNGNLIRHLWR
jgi:hypothetical protein